MSLHAGSETLRLQEKPCSRGDGNDRPPATQRGPFNRHSWVYTKERQELPRAMHANGRRWAATLMQPLITVLALWSTPSWANDIKRLFTEIEDSHRLGRIIEHNAAGVARNASMARRYRVVEVDIELLKNKEPFHLNLFDDVSLLVETLEWSVGANAFHRKWRGRILDFGQSRQHVEMVRQELAEQELPPGVPENVLEQTYLEVTGYASSYDVDAETGIANRSGQRRYGRVSPDGPESGSVVSPEAPWKLVHEAFWSFRIRQVLVPASGEVVSYHVSSLQWSPRYAMIVEVDPTRIASNIANPVERKALIEEGLRFERSLPSEKGKVIVGEIE